jgi:hypothetical protein
VEFWKRRTARNQELKDTQMNGAGLSSSTVSPIIDLNIPRFGILKRAPADGAEVGRAARTVEKH